MNLPRISQCGAPYQARLEQALAKWMRLRRYNQASELYHATFVGLVEQSVAPQTAASDIVRISASYPDPTEALDAIYAYIVDTFPILPEAHIALVELIVALEHTPGRVSNHSQPNEDDYSWSKLPSFGMQMRETWNWDPREQDWEGWRNANRFAALLTVTQTSCLRMYSLYGLWQLRAALEGGRNHPNQMSKADHLNQEIPAAAEWIFNAGSLLFTLEDEWPPAPNRGKPGAGGVLWEGKHGFCKGRWNLWHARFTKLSDFVGLESDVRDLAKRAAEEMARIEAVASDSSEVVVGGE